MKFNLFGLFGRKNATEDVAKPSPAPEPPIAQFQTDFGKAILSMTDEQARASWERREAQENRKARRFRIGMAIYEAYPEVDRDDRHDYEREITKLVMNSEDDTNLVIAQIRKKEISLEQILEELKKNMSVGNAVRGNSPAP